MRKLQHVLAVRRPADRIAHGLLFVFPRRTGPTLRVAQKILQFSGTEGCSKVAERGRNEVLALSQFQQGCDEVSFGAARVADPG